MLIPYEWAGENILFCKPEHRERRTSSTSCVQAAALTTTLDPRPFDLAGQDPSRAETLMKHVNQREDETVRPDKKHATGVGATAGRRRSRRPTVAPAPGKRQDH